jgi:hypothetical protein
MFDFDIFPEDSYDPSSGEFSADFDFEPIPLGTVLFDDSGKIYGKVFSYDDDINEAQRIFDTLSEVVQAGRFDPSYNPLNPTGYPPLPEGGVNFNDKKHTRGPFFLEQVRRFLTRTGLDSVSEVFYDEELDAYWIEIDTP